MATPAWPPEVATKSYYQTLKRDASVKRGTRAGELGEWAELNAVVEGVRREQGLYWEGVGRGSLLERCVLQVVVGVMSGCVDCRGGRDLPPELVQLVVDVLRAVCF